MSAKPTATTPATLRRREAHKLGLPAEVPAFWQERSPQAEAIRRDEAAAAYAPEVIAQQRAALTTQMLDVARDLRRMAAEVEQAANRTYSWGTTVSEETDKVVDIQHAVLWGVANLGLDRLANAAARLRETEASLIQR